MKTEKQSLAIIFFLFLTSGVAWAQEAAPDVYEGLIVAAPPGPGGAAGNDNDAATEGYEGLAAWQPGPAETTDTVTAEPEPDIYSYVETSGLTAMEKRQRAQEMARQQQLEKRQKRKEEREARRRAEREKAEAQRAQQQQTQPRSALED